MFIEVEGLADRGVRDVGENVVLLDQKFDARKLNL
jgi:hypothetical protein